MSTISHEKYTKIKTSTQVSEIVEGTNTKNIKKGQSSGNQEIGEGTWTLTDKSQIYIRSHT
jgi:hypothetical protein